MRYFFPRSMIAVLLVIVAAAPAVAVSFDTGFKTGTCIANLSGDIPGLGSDFTTRYGFAGGVFFDFKLSERLSIQPEAMYMQKGSWIKNQTFQVVLPEGTFEGETDYEFRLWYFEFPLLAKYTMRRESFLSPFLFTGPAFSYSQRLIIDVSQTIGRYSFGVRDDISEDLKGWDFGVIFGGGLHCSFGGFSVFIEGRYNLGLRNLNNTEDDADIKNRAISALVGLNVKFSE